MMMEKLINDSDFALFRALMMQAAGIDLAPSKKQLVSSRLQRRLRACGVESFAEYHKLVTGKAGREEYERMVDLLTTHETYFFRESRHFDFLDGEVLKLLPQHGLLRFWSAACSSGEEACSIAMLLMERLGHARQWEVLASDISQEVIRRAQEGVYSATRLDNMPKSYLERYCEIFDDGGELRLRLNALLRTRMHFKRVNLNERMTSVGLFDVVFLRNVLIYFDSEHKREIVERVTRQIKPGGWLFIGHAETLNGLDLPFDLIVPTIYRKH